MDQDAREQAFHSALVTEHFVLQSAASATISESSSRSSLYLLSLSSSMVALGFTAASGDAALLAAAILPTIFVLGCFTIVRLVDTSIENVQSLRRISAIRRYYLTLMPERDDLFPTSGDDAADAQVMLGVRSNRLVLMFTMASMIGVVNAVVGAAAVGVVLEGLLGLARPLAVSVSVAFAVVMLGAMLLYQQRRFLGVFTDPTVAAVQRHS